MTFREILQVEMPDSFPSSVFEEALFGYEFAHRAERLAHSCCFTHLA